MCQARFRGARICSRCGADLGRLMRLSAEAWAMREQARRALALGRFADASEMVAIAQELEETAAGRSLSLVCQWMLADAPIPATRREFYEL